MSEDIGYWESLTALVSLPASVVHQELVAVSSMEAVPVEAVAATRSFDVCSVVATQALGEATACEQWPASSLVVV